MSEMIERVADDLQRKLKERGYLRFERQHLLWIVQTIIAAMREPTDDMRNLYFDLAVREGGPRDARSVFSDATWERMVDAALAEEKQPA